jgi:citrate/tricarballylate utilization protein
MERRLTFGQQDLVYLANLCHDCRECLHSCQYAPPHQFGVDLPAMFAHIRRETYRKYAWPGALAGLFNRQGPMLAAAIIGAPLALLALVAYFATPAAWLSAHADADGAFYAVMPHTIMVGAFGGVGLFAAVALGVGLVSCWREIHGTRGAIGDVRSIGVALRDALTLRYLDGAGDGCAYPGEIPSHARRWFHHAMFYGFLFCFASTSVAAFYHNVLGWYAPYHVMSVPVVLGCIGGAGLLLGPAGLLWLKIVHQPESADRNQARMDIALLVMLWLTAFTGFLLLALRESAVMGVVLAVHLGIVAGLFLTLPYGKFVHGIYRWVALVRYASENGDAVAGPKRTALR